MEQFSSYDIAIEKAKREKKVLVYSYSNDDYDKQYYNFYFFKLTDKQDFISKLFQILTIEKKSLNNSKAKIEIPDHLSNDDFEIVLDYWKRISVENVQEKKLCIKKHENEIFSNLMTINN
jgi:hypothetical protein